MAFLTSEERGFLRAVSKLGYCNPFLPERIEYEREALGRDFQEAEPIWSMRVADPESPHANVTLLIERIEALVQRMRESFTRNTKTTDQERELYQEAVLFLLYHQYRERLYSLSLRVVEEPSKPRRLSFYRHFLNDWEHYLHIPGIRLPRDDEPAHLFACFFQVRRAFHHIFSYLIGSSMAAARLRAAVWQSIFTHDMRRYRDQLYTAMGDITTLITGPTGTGKELVARAIGLSRYLPFDPKALTFSEGSFIGLNLSALPSTLIESELFGHRRGAFTGALQDRRGWFEVCPATGAVFLDEVGDLDASTQVKLLRVLQTHTFQRIGDTKDRHFNGKLIAATNRNLVEAMQQGRFREDFYYRLCSDVIATPSLHEQLGESPSVLRELILYIARRVAGAGAEALADDVEGWIQTKIGREYPWPGNIRELEQCVRNVLIRKEYHPARPLTTSTHGDFASACASGTLTAEELLRTYCTLVYSQTGSYEETARRVQLDRRTIKSRIDQEILAQLRANS